LHHRVTVIFEIPCSSFAADTPAFVLESKTALSSPTLEGLEEDIGINGEKLEDWRLMFQLLQGG